MVQVRIAGWLNFLRGLNRGEYRKALHVLAYLLLQEGPLPQPLPPTLSKVLLRCAKKAGIRLGMSAQETRSKLDAHFRQHPPDPVLLRDFAAHQHRAASHADGFLHG